MSFWEFFEGLHTLFTQDWDTSLMRVLLMLLGFLLIYLGYRQILEPLIMIPMGIGIIAVNAGVLYFEAKDAVVAKQAGTLFVAPLISDPTELMKYLQIDFLQPIYNFTFSNGLIACLVFMGIGAITDIDYLIAKPWMSMMLAVGAELGTVATLPIAVACGLTPHEAASVALVGGADGPVVIFGSVILAPQIFVPLSVVAYVYLSLCYAGYPYLIKLMVPKEKRGIVMDLKDVPKISSGEKFAFAIVACGVLSLLFPMGAPLFASFFVGLAIKEARINRYIEFLSGPLLYGATFFLAFTLGALLSADIVMDSMVAKLLGLGMLALLLSGVGGLLGGLAWNKFSKKPFNPLIGIAAVSCVPTTAKVAQKCAYQANKRSMILPYAMGPCVAGVITTAILGAIYVSAVDWIK
jgi:sodium ion-translocating decarboxylase beta subunit